MCTKVTAPSEAGDGSFLEAQSVIDQGPCSRGGLLLIQLVSAVCGSTTLGGASSSPMAWGQWGQWGQQPCKDLPWAGEPPQGCLLRGGQAGGTVGGPSPGSARFVLLLSPNVAFLDRLIFCSLAGYSDIVIIHLECIQTML